MLLDKNNMTRQYIDDYLSDTDTGKVDQKIHAGDVDGFLDQNLVVRKIVVDILACHIVFIEQHQC